MELVTIALATVPHKFVLVLALHIISDWFDTVGTHFGPSLLAFILHCLFFYNHVQRIFSIKFPFSNLFYMSDL